MRRFQLLNSRGGDLSLEPAPGQACDQCRARKTRCNRGQPCIHCIKTRRTCSYEQVPKTRGRKVQRRTADADSHFAEEAEESGDWEQDGHDLLPAGPSVHDGPQPLPATDTSSQTAFAALPFCATIAQAQGVADDQQVHPLTPFTDTEWQDITPLKHVPSIDHQQPVFTPEVQQHAPWLENDLDRPQMFNRECFVPYVELFFDRLYAVFPVIEKQSLMELLETPHFQSQPLPPTIYTFLTALSAAVMVQLNLLAGSDTAAQAPEPGHYTQQIDIASCVLSPGLMVTECLETRRSGGFIEDADEWTILSSFFLFAYYGNCNQSRSAWYYLREAIGFAQSLGLDDTKFYVELDPQTCQRRRLVFWLLFITERAYALQHRSRVILQPSIELPHVFESSQPKLMYGFVTLARVFAAADNAFIAAWSDQNNSGADHPAAHHDVSQALMTLLRNDSQTEALPIGEINEVQRLDIIVTLRWLKTLAWQLLSRLGPSAIHQVIATSEPNHSTCIVEVSRSLLATLHTADTSALEAHGIGMEQKVSDVANCLCDVLEAEDSNSNAQVDYASAPDLLHNFIVFLAKFRSHESQYLPPLLSRASSSLFKLVYPPCPLLLEDGEGLVSQSDGRLFLDGTH